MRKLQFHIAEIVNGRGFPGSDEYLGALVGGRSQRCLFCRDAEMIAAQVGCGAHGGRIWTQRIESVGRLHVRLRELRIERGGLVVRRGGDGCRTRLLEVQGNGYLAVVGRPARGIAGSCSGGFRRSQDGLGLYFIGKEMYRVHFFGSFLSGHFLFHGLAAGRHCERGQHREDKMIASHGVPVIIHRNRLPKQGQSAAGHQRRREHDFPWQAQGLRKQGECKSLVSYSCVFCTKLIKMLISSALFLGRVFLFSLNLQIMVQPQPPVKHFGPFLLIAWLGEATHQAFWVVFAVCLAR